MANFIPSKKEAKDFNNGNQYVAGDAVQAETINNLVESALYSQESVENGIQEAKTIANSAATMADEALDKSTNAESIANGLAAQIGAANLTANEAREIANGLDQQIKTANENASAAIGVAEDVKSKLDSIIGPDALMVYQHWLFIESKTSACSALVLSRRKEKYTKMQEIYADFGDAKFLASGALATGVSVIGVEFDENGVSFLAQDTGDEYHRDAYFSDYVSTIRL